MSTLSFQVFLKTLPQYMLPHLPTALQGIHIRQPWRWLLQFHYGEPRLHYEVARAKGRPGLELGFHCEARDKALNRLLLRGFRQNLFEIKDMLGESIEAEMWDRGWTKIYEVYPERPLTQDYQELVGERLAAIILCLHPIYVDMRTRAAKAYR